MKIIKAYYGSRISPNMTRTPDGFLICHNVPIARTGYQEYLGQEIGFDDRYGEVIKVYRPEDEVFKPEALASFEGKPVTDDHPRGEIRPDNWSAYARGTCTNVRRGTGGDVDKVIADLIIYDALMQSEIEAGKREVSCGYDYNKEVTADGQVILRDIRGNHVAIVKEGRAGRSVSIQDENTIKRGSRKMNNKQNTLGKMLKAFARDAEPEEMEDAMELMAEGGKEPEAASAPPPAQDEGTGESDALGQILAKLGELDTRISAVEAGKTADEDPLEGLEQALATEPGAGAEEESVTLPAEQMEEKGMTDNQCVRAADRQVILSMVRAIKPAIADLPPTERKKVGDSLNTAIRGAMGKTVQPVGDQYAALMQNRQITLAADAAKAKIDELDVQDAYNKRNPHYDKGGK